jgi:hypothetical protein
MTVGGLAVAIGGLVDDATVSVENVFRRLKLNRQSGSPQSELQVVFQASEEVRNPRVFGTLIVVLVFAPVFALGAWKGAVHAAGNGLSRLGGLVAAGFLDRHSRFWPTGCWPRREPGGCWRPCWRLAARSRCLAGRFRAAWRPWDAAWPPIGGSRSRCPCTAARPC